MLFICNRVGERHGYPDGATEKIDSKIYPLPRLFDSRKKGFEDTGGLYDFAKNLTGCLRRLDWVLP
jgi:hypothetical protein